MYIVNQVIVKKLCCTADMESGGIPEKEAAEIKLRAIIKINLVVACFFVILAKQECTSPYKMREQLGIEDDILRKLEMCLQQVKCVHIRIRGLLANLHY